MDKLLTVRINEDLLNKVKAATTAKGMTMAEVVRAGLEEFVGKSGGAKTSTTKAKAKSPSRKPAVKKAAPKAAAKKKAKR